MNIWHDIDPALITPDRFMAVIEIKRGGKTNMKWIKQRVCCVWIACCIPRRIIRPTTALSAHLRGRRRPARRAGALLGGHRADDAGGMPPDRHVRNERRRRARRKNHRRAAGRPGITTTCSTSASFRNTCLTKSAISSPFIRNLKGAQPSSAKRKTAKSPTASSSSASTTTTNPSAKKDKKNKDENKKGESK